MTTVQTMPLMCQTALGILTLLTTLLTTETTETMEESWLIMEWREKLSNMIMVHLTTLVTMEEDLNMTPDLTIIRRALLF